MSSWSERRFLVPEVIQTSAMDCGPAALKALLEGFGIPVSYARLREVCQTDVDGSSIDSLEEIALDLGLKGAQVMIPADHVFLSNAGALPAVVVIRHPNGNTHFVVAWNRVGRLVQIMDPGSGRSWRRKETIERQLYIHSVVVPVETWTTWATSEDCKSAYRERLRAVGIAPSVGVALMPSATDDWRVIARFDAAVRMIAAFVAARALRRGKEAQIALKAVLETDADTVIPADYWSVSEREIADGEAQLAVRGAVLIAVSGKTDGAGESAPRQHATVLNTGAEARVRPLAELARLLRRDGFLATAPVAFLWGIVSIELLAQALLFRAAFGKLPSLLTRAQVSGALFAVIALAAVLLLQRLPTATAIYRYGRLLEAEYRLAILRKLPRLGDRYFQSRLAGDMAERSHSIVFVRLLPYLAVRLIGALLEMAATAAGILWIDWRLAPLVIASLLFSLGIPLLTQPALTERDLRIRTHLGALGRYALDALLGVAAIRAHSAERAMRREQNNVVSEWARASFALLRVAVGTEALQTIATTAVAAAMLFSYMSRHSDSTGVLLVIYWALNLPLLGNVVADSARQYPATHNVAMRLSEIITAPEASTQVSPRVAMSSQRGMAIVASEIGVQAAGHTILHNVTFRISPGEHVAIVGRSGAGKSTLLSLLLGWNEISTGSLKVDGEPLDPARLFQISSEIAWVDPAIHLWNRSFLQNITYGSPSLDPSTAASLVRQAELLELLQALPDGLQTPLGEGGGVVSGGEGQRVRLARAMCRKDARLVLLDEPFRGLDGASRRRLLVAARNHWSAATLLCVTHDIRETRTFDRVMVVADGAIVEDDRPEDLAARASSVYARLLGAETAATANVWGAHPWRRVRVERGTISEG